MWVRIECPQFDLYEHPCIADMAHESIRELLSGLSSARPDTAWDRFLRDYSPQILHVVRRYENDDDRVSDCYLLVCEKLSDGRFSRLLKFKPDGSAKFSTWLTTVIANLCVDWRRKQFGRRRVTRVVGQLPAIEQLVFRHLYERGMTRIECLRALRYQYTDITHGHIARINSHLHSLLSPKQRWRLVTRKGETISLSETNPEDQPQIQPAHPGPDVDVLVQSEQDRERLEEAMKQLSSDDRLILRLRYEQDLTLADIAHLMDLADPFRARRKIESAVAKLAELMNV